MYTIHFSYIQLFLAFFYQFFLTFFSEKLEMNVKDKGIYITFEIKTIFNFDFDYFIQFFTVQWLKQGKHPFSQIDLPY